MTDEKLARLRAHDNNISRYRRLLKTNLSDLERRFLERRLSEERSAVESLAHPAPTPRTGRRIHDQEKLFDCTSPREAIGSTARRSIPYSTRTKGGLVGRAR